MLQATVLLSHVLAATAQTLLSVDSYSYVLWHNVKRCMHGTPEVTWDTSLATSAGQWAQTCSGDHTDHLSELRIGENIYGHPNMLPTASQVLEGWYDIEARNYNFNNQRYQSSASEMTQVVWAATARIGCAACQKRTGWRFVVCHYSPMGNGPNFNVNVPRPIKTQTACLPRDSPAPSPVTPSPVSPAFPVRYRGSPSPARTYDNNGRGDRGDRGDRGGAPIRHFTPSPRPTPSPPRPSPSNSPVPSDSPAASESPELSMAPLLSESPVASESPAPSELPPSSESPAPSESPEPSSSPLRSASPAVSWSPPRQRNGNDNGNGNGNGKGDGKGDGKGNGNSNGQGNSNPSPSTRPRGGFMGAPEDKTPEGGSSSSSSSANAVLWVVISVIGIALVASWAFFIVKIRHVREQQDSQVAAGNVAVANVQDSQPEGMVGKTMSKLTTLAAVLRRPSAVDTKTVMSTLGNRDLAVEEDYSRLVRPTVP